MHFRGSLLNKQYHYVNQECTLATDNSQNLQREMLMLVYRCSIECTGIIIWCASCSAVEKRTLQCIIDFAQEIIGCLLHSLKDVSNSHHSRAGNLVKDCTHLGYHLFELLLSGCFICISSRTKPLKGSFYTWIKRLLLHATNFQYLLNFSSFDAVHVFFSLCVGDCSLISLCLAQWQINTQKVTFPMSTKCCLK